MKIYVIKKMTTQFMQSIDIFNKHKVVYKKIEFDDDCLDKNLCEAELIRLATVLFGDNIIFIQLRNRPVLIRQDVQVLSNGETWFKLIDLLKHEYPYLKFNHDERFMNITIKEEYIAEKIKRPKVPKKQIKK